MHFINEQRRLIQLEEHLWVRGGSIASDHQRDLLAFCPRPLSMFPAWWFHTLGRWQGTGYQLITGFSMSGDIQAFYPFLISADILYLFAEKSDLQVGSL